MKVNEIFYSIQGEGVNQGLPTVFVRLNGCNLRCSYCDTNYALGSDYRELDEDEIVQEIVKLSPSTGTRVCITGGEPLLQEEGLKSLVARLNKFNYYIEVFSNGSFPKPVWWTRVHSWVIDIKCPSSGANSANAYVWLNSRSTDQIKLTVGTEEDLDYASTVIAMCALRSPKVIVSPVVDLGRGLNQEWAKRVVEFCLEKRVRLSLQWHKFIYGNRRGV